VDPKPKCVLAIALDWRMRRLLRVNLEVMGLQVREAVNGPHGLQLIPETRPDLILVDLDELNVRAEDVIEAIRSRLAGRGTPILVLSAEPSDCYLLHLGSATSCLEKPFSAAVLSDRVVQALGLARDIQ